MEKKSGPWWRKYTKRHIGYERPKRMVKKPRKMEEEEEYYDPFEEMHNFIGRVLDRTFRDFGPDIFRIGFGRPRMLKMEEGIFREPHVDIQETDKEIIARIELPGASKNNIKIKCLEDHLIVDAQIKKESERKGRGFFGYSASYKGYRRVIPLPVPVDKNKSKAHYENGMLTVVLAKKYPGEGPSDIQIE